MHADSASMQTSCECGFRVLLLRKVSYAEPSCLAKSSCLALGLPLLRKAISPRLRTREAISPRLKIREAIF
ncbi:hypothetical protein ACLB2K_063179 [Fragaria x ananassa]